MKSISVDCPAKINLTLEIVNRREDGFHNIKSIMQTINLYDTLKIQIENFNKLEIFLDGNNKEIPYNDKNLVHKACNLFFKETGITNKKVCIYINKRIPIAAGLAGGSTDAAGTFVGLNKLLNNPLSKGQLHNLCAQLGSDLNVCLEGGTILATSRGEIIQKLDSITSEVTLIKPKNLGISAKEAYTKYAKKELKPQNNMTEKMLDAINNKHAIQDLLYNDLEYAIFDDYQELQTIKKEFPKSIMSGSGSTYFLLENIDTTRLGENYQIIKNLHFINTGIICNNFVTY